MPDTLGADMFNLPEKYYVTFDNLTKTFRIIDTKHPEIHTLRSGEQVDMDVEIPDDHPAVTVIPELMFWKLMSKAESLGMISGMGSDNSETTKLLKDTIKAQEEEIKKLEQNQQKPGSEKFLLKNKVIDTLLKMSTSEDIDEITRLS